MLKEAKKVFIIGIKGAAMSNLAVILQKMGKQVTGADLSEEFITDKLLEVNKISYFTDFDKKNLSLDTDLIIYSAAHQGVSNPIAIEGKKRKIKVLSQAEVIGELSGYFKKTIAVCGCHGKTTTSALLVYALKKLGGRPSYLIGAPYFNDFPGGDLDGLDLFIIEADEYGVNPPFDKTPKFNFLKPDYIICNNIDFDHPDVYKNLDETKQIFLQFLQKGNKLFLCADDLNLMDVAKNLEKDKYRTFGYDINSDFNIDKEKFGLSIPGKKNKSNAAGVIICLLSLGYKIEEIKQVISGFTGAKRRFEKIYIDNNFSLYDDYAHHPNEIKATISAAREKFAGKRIIIIFQPHTYSRTLSLLTPFADSLALADISYVLPIFASAREKSSDYKISSRDIENQAKKKGRKNIISIADKQELLKRLRTNFQKGDIIMTMGAGDVYKLSGEIIETLKVKQLVSELKGKTVELNKDLTNLLTLHTKTTAEYYFEAKSKEDWRKAIRSAYNLKIPVFVLGGGSNIAITKNKIEGLVIKNSYIKKEILRQTDTDVEVLVSSGYPTGFFVNQMIDAGYEGVEYHKGLPGTVGGAVYMNSKWTKPLKYFGDSIVSALLLSRNGEFKTVKKDDYSVLHNSHEILIEIVFRFAKADPLILKQRAETAALYRMKSQPRGVASCGCFFRNISEEDRIRLKLPTTSIGYLIDKLGLKGMSVGNFIVSDVHANFIINKGGQKSNTDDLKKLLELIKDKIRKKYGIELKEEVIVI